MACRCSKSLLALRDQLNATYPGRSIVSDGCCASQAHHKQNPSSDHEPDAAGFAHAYDITHDPAHGVDCNVLAACLMRDTRVKYLIWQRRIWFPRARTGGRPAGWSSYSGPNPHTKHLHVSIIPSATDVTARWPLTLPTPAPQPQEDDLTKDEHDTLQQTHDAVARLDTWHDQLNGRMDRLEAAVKAIEQAVVR